MRTFTAIIERCPDTGMFVGHVPDFPGAHSQGATLEELRQNLQEVIVMLLEEGPPPPSSDSAPTPTPTIPSTYVGAESFEVA